MLTADCVLCFQLRGNILNLNLIPAGAQKKNITPCRTECIVPLAAQGGRKHGETDPAAVVVISQCRCTATGGEPDFLNDAVLLSEVNLQRRVVDGRHL
jgi:hypothetical protein